MNNYFRDSLIFIKKASESISPEISDEDSIIAIMGFALGLERIFKGILFDINPIYVLIHDSFKESAAVLYTDRLLPGYKGSKEINSKPLGDVITFRMALDRIKWFSQTANSYSGLFYTISTYRDIIAHCELKDLDITKIKIILNRDFIQVIEKFSKELNNSEILEAIEKEKYNKLNDFSQKIIKTEEIDKKVKAKLALHHDIWNSKKNNGDDVRKSKMETEIRIDTHSKYYSYEGFDCPACKNTAIITLEFDSISAEAEESGAYLTLTELHCFYCDLEIKTFEELDYLELEQTYYEEYYDSMNDIYLD